MGDCSSDVVGSTPTKGTSHINPSYKLISSTHVYFQHYLKTSKHVTDSTKNLGINRIGALQNEAKYVVSTWMGD